jgi:hypothetical protein
VYSSSLLSKLYLLSDQTLNPIDGRNYFDGTSDIFRSGRVDLEYRSSGRYQVKPKENIREAHTWWKMLITNDESQRAITWEKFKKFLL